MRVRYYPERRHVICRPAGTWHLGEAYLRPRNMMLELAGRVP